MSHESRLALLFVGLSMVAFAFAILIVRHRCCGVRKTWPWKGFRCGSWATIKVGFKWYCANHAPRPGSR